jgi:hypothetical protein
LPPWFDTVFGRYEGDNTNWNRGCENFLIDQTAAHRVRSERKNIDGRRPNFRTFNRLPSSDGERERPLVLGFTGRRDNYSRLGDSRFNQLSSRDLRVADAPVIGKIQRPAPGGNNAPVRSAIEFLCRGTDTLRPNPAFNNQHIRPSASRHRKKCLTIKAEPEDSANADD